MQLAVRNPERYLVWLGNVVGQGAGIIVVIYVELFQNLI